MCGVKLQKTNYYVKRPSQRRKVFGIYSQVVHASGSTTNKTVHNADLESINCRFLSGAICEQQALKLVVAIKDKLKATVNKKPSTQNQSVLDAFLTAYFKRKRFLVDKESAKNKFTRAVNAIGQTPILSASEDELLDAVLKQAYECNKSRDVVHKLNSILTWLKRDIKVCVPPASLQNVD